MLCSLLLMFSSFATKDAVTLIDQLIKECAELDELSACRYVVDEIAELLVSCGQPVR